MLNKNSDKLVLLLFSMAYIILYILIFDSKFDTGGDNINYYLLGKALNDGLGFVNLYSANVSPHTHYPPGYPAIICALMQFAENPEIPKILNGILLFLTLLISYHVFYSTGSKNRFLVLTSLIVVGLNPHLLRYSTIIMSEIPYLFITTLILWVFLQLQERSFTYISAYFISLIILTAISLYLRSVGITIFLTVLICFLLERKFVTSAIYASGVILLMVPWTIRNYYIGAGGGYLNQLLSVNPYDSSAGVLSPLEMSERVFTNILRYINKEVPNLILSDLDISYNLEFDGLYFSLGLILIFLIVLGLHRQGKQYYLFGIYILLNFGILLLWPEKWYGVRFIVILLPLLIFFLFEGLFYFLKRIEYHFSLNPKVASTLLISFGIFIVFMSYTSIKDLVNKANEDYPDNYRSFFDMAKWVKANSSDSAIIASRKPEFFYLFSSRSGVRLIDSPNEEEQITYLKDMNVDYLVLDNLGFTTSRKYLLPTIKKYPLKFEQVRLSGEPATILMKFHPELGYWGEWHEGQKHGDGLYRFKDGAVYLGGWKNDKMHGKGLIKTKDGRITRGIWENGNLVKTEKD